jgi:RimJ/RimL family protein N-acetyltransferase
MNQLLIPGPAYRIHTARLVVRCYNPSDAPLLKAAVDANLDHLRPWMPWALAEPTDLNTKVDLLRRFRAQFDLGQNFTYGIFNPEESELLGGTGMHTRLQEQAREIGYWIRQDQTNRGLATEAAAALTQIAFELDGVDRVEIHCQPSNVRSAAVPRKLGYNLEATLRRRGEALGQRVDLQVWTLFRDEYPTSPSAQVKIEAFDAAGRRILYGGQKENS